MYTIDKSRTDFMPVHGPDAFGSAPRDSAELLQYVSLETVPGDNALEFR